MSDTPLRILQLYPKEDYFTGAAIQVRELALGLQARGHDVIIGTRPSDIWRAKNRQAGVRHHAPPMASVDHLPSVWRSTAPRGLALQKSPCRGPKRELKSARLNSRHPGT